MTTKKIWVLPLLLLNFFVLASCSFSKLDGDWDAMEWKEEVEVQKINGAYMVPPSGTSLSFTCRNYSQYWFSDAKEDGQEIAPPWINHLDYGLIYGDYFRAEIHGNKLSIVFEPNEGAHTRNINITVTAGDIFYTFKFIQATSDPSIDPRPWH